MKIVYFAWLRDRVGVSEETLSVPASVGDVGGLIDWLKERGPGHAQAFADLSIVRVAVNQEYVQADHPVTDSDEVAFFPPVTGG